MSNLDRVKDALLSVTQDTFHYRAQGVTDKYIVWAEDGQADAVWADEQMQEQTIEGTADYYTRMENDPNVQLIQNALNDAYISWRLNSVQYEDETQLIHHEWVWRVEGW